MSLICQEFNKLKKELIFGGNTYQNLNTLVKHLTYKTSYKLDYFLYKMSKLELYEFFLVGDRTISMSNSKVDFIRKIKLVLINGGFLYA